MFGLSYWLFPLFAACTWFGTLLAMMIVWLAQGRQHLSSFAADQYIPYISDIGATGLKPLFIAGSAVTVVVFDVVFIAERYLRHNGRLALNTSWTQKILSLCAGFFAVVGAAGLILLTIFDTVHHHTAHDVLTAVFIAGYIVSAIFVCAEYQRLGIHYRQHRILRGSFWMKLAFIIVEICLAIAFGVCGDKEYYNVAAVLEWTIALIFILYVLSYVVDFLPALGSRQERFRKDAGEGAGVNELGGPEFTDGGHHTPAATRSHHAHTPSHASTTPMQHVNNGTYLNYEGQVPVETNVPASRNF